MPVSSVRVSAVLLLLIPWVSTQVAQSASDDSPKLRFVAQLSVSGCSLLVHDTGADDGPHLAVEPVMCVTGGLHKVAARYDPVTQQTYVSVPVTVREDAMLAEVRHHLQHLSPKSVKFATVSSISVSTDSSSKFQALGFIWSPEETVGFLRLGCKMSNENCGICNLKSQFEVLDQVLLLATVILNDTNLQLNYRLTIQNHSFINPDFYIDRFETLPECGQLRFARSIRLSNCTARMHQRLDMKGHFLIEPLLCHNINSMNNESVMYDQSRDMYYLKLDLVLQDNLTVNAVLTQLADLSPRSVTFMRLWRAQSHVASALSRRFEIVPLMVSRDWMSAQQRVYCRTEAECRQLKFSVITEPVDLWQHLMYSVTSLKSDQCLLKSDVPKHPWRMQEGGRAPDLRCSLIAVFNNTGTGRSGSVQSTTVNITGCYRITAAGARGGTTYGGLLGGRGARIAGYFSLTARTELSVVVGQRGGNSSQADTRAGAGGGGGTFVYRSADNFLLLAAGGGGGGCYSAGTGAAGQASQNGTDTPTINALYKGFGGTLGQAGVVNVAAANSCCHFGGAGAGWLSKCGATQRAATDALSGGSRADGWIGGLAGSRNSGAVGGFGGGGGGGSNCGGGGGGGGYSGGGAGVACHQAGGGGGSFCGGGVCAGVTGGNANSEYGSVVMEMVGSGC